MNTIADAVYTGSCDFGRHSHQKNVSIYEQARTCKTLRVTKIVSSEMVPSSGRHVSPPSAKYRSYEETEVKQFAPCFEADLSLTRLTAKRHKRQPCSSVQSAQSTSSTSCVVVCASYGQTIHCFSCLPHFFCKSSNHFLHADTQESIVNWVEFVSLQMT